MRAGSESGEEWSTESLTPEQLPGCPGFGPPPSRAVSWVPETVMFSRSNPGEVWEGALERGWGQREPLSTVQQPSKHHKRKAGEKAPGASPCFGSLSMAQEAAWGSRAEAGPAQGPWQGHLEHLGHLLLAQHQGGRQCWRPLSLPAPPPSHLLGREEQSYILMRLFSFCREMSHLVLSRGSVLRLPSGLGRPLPPHGWHLQDWQLRSLAGLCVR